MSISTEGIEGPGPSLPGAARRSRTERRSSIVAAFAVAVLLGAGLLVAGCSAAGDPGEASEIGGPASAGAPARADGGAGGSGDAGSDGGRSGAGGPDAAPAWPTSTAEVETRSRSVQVGGRLRPRARITHAAPIAGIVREVAVEPGDAVDPGIVLFVIERNEVGQSFRPTAVEARIGGVVSEVMLQPEEQVSAGDPGAVVVGRDGYVLDARVSDKDIAGVAVGRTVSARASDGTMVSGRLSVRGEEPDYETGLFPVTIRFPNAQGIGIGTFLLVELPTAEIEGVFVPRDAVDRRYGRSFLWVVDEDEGILARREVSLGEAFGDAVLVADGISPGERYVVRLSGREREGAPAPPAQESAGDDGAADGGGES